MNRRERLRDLVEKLPESELGTAIRILEVLDEREKDNEALTRALENAREDDEPYDKETSREAKRDEDEPNLAHEEVRRRLLG